MVFCLTNRVMKSKFHGLRLWRMRKIVKSVFPFQVFPFVRYKILLRFTIILYFVSLFLFLFFGEKDDVLFPNVVERNVQSFTQSSVVQYYSQSFHDTKTSISAKTFIPQKSPYFLSSYSLPLTLFNVCFNFPPFPFRDTVHYPRNRLVHSGPESLSSADASHLQMSIQEYLTF